MKAIEIMNELFSLSNDVDYSHTWDTCKAGDPEVEVRKVATAMFATPDVVRQVKAWGAELLIVHECTYYNPTDAHSDEKIETAKRRLIEESGITLFRFHDHPHFSTPDIIALGMLRDMAFDADVEHTDAFDLVRIYLKQPLTPREIAKHLEEHLGLKHIRVCGAADVPCTEISGMFGTPGGVWEELQSDRCEVMLTGEACEWSLAEYARDAGELGFKKALLILGHVGSERNGMKYTGDLVKERHPELDVRYFECGEVYTYTDCG